ncbi:S-adenosyl-L-methionine-binding protein [bacterium BMS3Bbin05]|nr:S-adenosyl-L-methionine-binding protein [bacterium BMS3Bbin05]
MEIRFKPIGYVKTMEKDIPRHWTVSDIEGEIVIDKKYKTGLKDIKAGQRIVVIFYFHKGPGFTDKYLIQKPPHKEKETGLFSTCSPVRPNPIGLSVLDVLEVEENVIYVRGIDMVDGTPVLDIKPYHNE